MSQKRSPLWTYFEVDVSDPKSAICKICGKTESRGSNDPSKMTTHRLNKHLEKFHTKENKIVKDLKAKNNNVSSMSHGTNAGNTDSSIDHGSSSTSSSMSDDLKSLRTKEQRKAYFQQTIPEWADSNSKLAFNSKKAQEFHRGIFELIVLDCQPFSIVNDRGFLRYNQKLAPNFEV